MICPKCGMGYDPDFSDDAKAHRKYHNRIVNGVYARKIKSDEILYEKGDYRITIVNYFSPFAQRSRAEKAGLVAHKDTPFDFAPYNSEERLDERNVHIFLLYRKNRIIGFLLTEKREHVLRLTWEEYENAGGRKVPKVEHIWSIGLVWVHRKYRKKELGSQLVKVAVSYFSIKLKAIGWYVPFTDDGEKLARSLCLKSFYVAM
jgi:GNAT superfamily N-acetyltransferase